PTDASEPPVDTSDRAAEAATGAATGRISTTGHFPCGRARADSNTKRASLPTTSAQPPSAHSSCNACLCWRSMVVTVPFACTAGRGARDAKHQGTAPQKLQRPSPSSRQHRLLLPSDRPINLPPARGFSGWHSLSVANLGAPCDNGEGALFLRGRGDR